MTNIRPLALYADGKQVAVENRIRVQGKSCMTLIPDVSYVDVYNLTNEDLETIRRAEIITASGVDGSILSYGELEEVYTTSDDANDITTLVIVDGKKLRESSVYQTIGAGATVRNTLQTILGGSVFGAYLASEVRFPRGQTLTGKLLPIVRDLAKTAKARAFISHGQVHVVPKGGTTREITIPDREIEDVPEYANGVCILRTSVKGYAIGTMVIVEGKKYRLASQAVDADNYEGLWQSELMLVDETELSADGMEGG